MITHIIPAFRLGAKGRCQKLVQTGDLGRQDTEEQLFRQVEEQVRSHVEWLRLLIETLGALVIAAGVVLVVVALMRHLFLARGGSFNPIRLSFARYLTLALELQLAADILSTSVAPTWDRIGKLAAIAVIRTALNYFLSKELKDESADVASALPKSSRPDEARP